MGPWGPGSRGPWAPRARGALGPEGHGPPGPVGPRVPGAMGPPGPWGPEGPGVGPGKNVLAVQEVSNLTRWSRTFGYRHLFGVLA